MTTPIDPADSATRTRDAQVREARLRLSRLEAEMYRMRAELARLEAAGDEAKAERLEEALRRHEGDVHRERYSIAPERLMSLQNQSTTKEYATPTVSFAIPTADAGSTDTVEEIKVIASELPSESASISINKRAVDKPDSPSSRTSPSSRKRLPVWMVSLAVHVALLLPFGTLSFATLTQSPPQLQASVVDGADDFFDDLAEINFDDISDEELEIEELTTELDATDFNEIELAQFDSPLASNESPIVSPTAFDAPPSDFGALMTGVEGGGGAGQGGKSAVGSGTPRGGARFFGARSKGGSFVFVVDNSGTMQDGRLETTLFEIQRSVNKMADNQRFHVLFYSDQPYPMFFPKQTEKLEFATRENKRKLSAWLGTVQMCVGGRLINAMKLVEKMEPDTVFLLSDGDIGTGTMRYMTEPNEWGFVVNTLGMTVAEPEHAQNLLAIANAHNGIFTPVGVSPAAAQMAAQRPIRYWNTRSGPGPVWGTKVRKSPLR